mmetsp:Transcript_54530/g.119270  ORF Transcript_54530/g.119270 Transcript_54530/m.119270 type:complete len:140 (+) Transcript_54530:663-1082(+)
MQTATETWHDDDDDDVSTRCWDSRRLYTRSKVLLDAPLLGADDDARQMPARKRQKTSRTPCAGIRDMNHASGSGKQKTRRRRRNESLLDPILAPKCQQEDLRCKIYISPETSKCTTTSQLMDSRVKNSKMCTSLLTKPL